MPRPLPCLLALLFAAPAAAQEMDPGADLFAYYCASCHGDAATGDGPMAQYLTLPVPDLTGLSARNGGRFPMLDVVHRLDGSRPDLLHRTPMPNFGAVFDAETQSYGDEIAALLDRNGRILTLTFYLEGLQR